MALARDRRDWLAAARCWQEIDEILRIAETRCPVKDNLNNQTPITLRCAPVMHPALA